MEIEKDVYGGVGGFVKLIVLCYFLMFVFLFFDFYKG